MAVVDLTVRVRTKVITLIPWLLVLVLFHIDPPPGRPRRRRWYFGGVVTPFGNLLAHYED